MFDIIKYKTKKHLSRNFTSLIKTYRKLKVSRTYTESYWEKFYQSSLSLAKSVDEIPYYKFMSINFIYHTDN